MKKGRVRKRVVKKRKGFPAWALLALVISALILVLLATWMREKRHTAEGASQQSTSHMPRHGGTVRVVDQRKYELVLAPRRVALHVFDAAKQVTKAAGYLAKILAPPRVRVWTWSPTGETNAKRLDRLLWPGARRSSLWSTFAERLTQKVAVDPGW